MSDLLFNRQPIQQSDLESICQAIGHTTDGLTGPEIARLLSLCNLTDTDPAITKWKRLFNAFAHYQNTNRKSDQVLYFISQAMQPSRYVGKAEIFQHRLNELNKRFSFLGLELTNEGGFRQVRKATTLSDAEQRASNFKSKLEARNVHPDILLYCKAELLTENYFHSVFEATKSIADRLRGMTGVYADGNELADVVFSTGNPLIRINLLKDSTQRSEHIGLMNIIKGVFGLIRNPTAHAPKIKFPIEEHEALDIMVTISFIHKKLDKAL